MEPGSDPMTAIVPTNGKKPPIASSKNKKKRGAMSLIRVALFMWRRRGSKQSKAAVQIEVAAASAEMLNKVVGSMRPLHAKGGESPPHLSGQARPEPAEILMLPTTTPSPGRSDQFEDVGSGLSHSSSASEEGSTSRYSSALNLTELLKGEEGSDSDDDEIDEESESIEGRVDNYDPNEGDDMIDAKAEEFIARFYEQMRIQNYNETARQSGQLGW